MSAKSTLLSIVLIAFLLPVLVVGILAQEGEQPLFNSGTSPAQTPRKSGWESSAGNPFAVSAPATSNAFLGLERQLSPPDSVDANRHEPAIAYNSRNNEYLIVWQNAWPVGLNDVYARRVSADGKLLSWFAVATGTNDKFQADVVYNNATNEYLIVWMFDVLGDGSKFDIFGRLVAWDGSYQKPEFEIISWHQRSMWSPRVDWNSKRNEYLVVWSAVDTSGGQPGVPSDISSMTLDANGNIGTGRNLVTGDQPFEADVVYNPTRDEYFLVYVRTITTGSDIYGLRIHADNHVITPPGLIKINDDPYDQNQPSIATNMKDRYVVAWQSEDSQGRHFIYGQDLDLDGKTLQGWIMIFETKLSRPAVAAEFGDVERYLVAWEDTTPGGKAVMARMFGPDEPSAVRFTVSEGTSWESAAPALAKGNIGYYFAYEGDSTSDPAVHGHIYGRSWVQHGVLLPIVRRP